MRDEEFIRNKVPMTKSEVRAISIDKLALQGAESLLDVGAGTGSVSIQAAREHPGLRVTAIERNPDGIQIIQQNLAKFNLKNVEVIKGTAPQDLPEQQFSTIFIGGSGADLAGIIRYAYRHLEIGGRLVLNFILVENALAAEELVHAVGFSEVELVEVGVLKWHQLGKGHYFKPNNPTIILSAIKEEHN